MSFSKERLIHTHSNTSEIDNLWKLFPFHCPPTQKTGKQSLIAQTKTSFNPTKYRPERGQKHPQSLMPHWFSYWNPFRVFESWRRGGGMKRSVLGHIARCAIPEFGMRLLPRRGVRYNYPYTPRKGTTGPEMKFNVICYHLANAMYDLPRNREFTSPIPYTQRNPKKKKKIREIRGNIMRKRH